MTQRFILLASAALTLSVATSHSEAQSVNTANTINTVLVRGTQICTLQNGAALKCFTSNSNAKSLPVWSKDGTQIAYIEQTDGSVALANLVVIDQHGQTLSKMPVKPVTAGEVPSGMRFVEAVQWLTNQTIVISGSINPGTTEYNIYFVGGTKPVTEFGDDGFGATFSPDGQHYANVSGSPHFSLKGTATPTLNIDGSAVYKFSSQDLNFADKPVWSADGKSVAVHAMDSAGNHHVVRWNVGAGSATVMPLAIAAKASTTMFWAAGTLHVQQQVAAAPSTSPASLGKKNFTNKSWMITNSGVLTAETTAPVDPSSKAKTMRASLSSSTQILGGKDYNFWCATCDLTLLPRRSGAAD